VLEFALVSTVVYIQRHIGCAFSGQQLAAKMTNLVHYTSSAPDRSFDCALVSRSFESGTLRAVWHTLPNQIDVCQRQSTGSAETQKLKLSDAVHSLTVCVSSHAGLYR
jgi:Tfp pilus assembly protein PilV